jgi:hypothetical protein
MAGAMMVIQEKLSWKGAFKLQVDKFITVATGIAALRTFISRGFPCR